MRAKLAEKRYTYNGEDLTIAREKAGYSQAELGELCGWSRQYQYKLERPGEHIVSEDTIRILREYVELTTIE